MDESPGTYVRTDQVTVLPEGVRGQERSTCERCGRGLVRRAGARTWRHVPKDGSCGDRHAEPVRPGAALRVLLLALLAAGVCDLSLYDDGFEVAGGADDASLLFVRGTFTGEQVAGLLGVPIEAVSDQRPGQAGVTWRAQAEEASR